MPVGRIQYLYMWPMTFFEFLIASNQNKILDSLKAAFPNYPLKVEHEKLLNLWNEYCFVGGMPEAVDAFLKTESFVAARDVHREIVKTYQDDFPKYCKEKGMAL